MRVEYLSPRNRAVCDQPHCTERAAVRLTKYAQACGDKLGDKLPVSYRIWLGTKNRRVRYKIITTVEQQHKYARVHPHGGCWLYLCAVCWAMRQLGVKHQAGEGEGG